MKEEFPLANIIEDKVSKEIRNLKEDKYASISEYIDAAVHRHECQEKIKENMEALEELYLKKKAAQEEVMTSSRRRKGFCLRHFRNETKSPRPYLLFFRMTTFLAASAICFSPIP